MRDIKYITLWKFFLPLWFSGFLQGFTINLINSGLARMERAAVLIAAFALARGLMQTVISPMHMIRPTIASLTHNRKSFRVVRKFVLSLTMTLSILLSTIAWSGLLEKFLLYIMKVDPVATASTVTIAKLIVFYPLGLIVKDFFIGVSIRFEKTYLGTIGSIVRTLYLFIAISQIHRFANIPGEVIASLIFIFAPVTEGLTLFILLKRSMGSISGNIPETESEQQDINFRSILIFYAPLSVMAIINSFSQPFINGGITRFSDNIIYLTAYSVGFGVIMNFIFPLKLIQQVSVMYSHRNKEKVFRFALGFGIVMSLLVAVLAFTTVGKFILLNMVGVDENIAAHALIMAKIMIPLPLITVSKEFLTGYLIKKRDTGIIGSGKIIYLITLAVTFAIYLKLFNFNPLISATAANITAELIELSNIFKNYIKGEMK